MFSVDQANPLPNITTDLVKQGVDAHTTDSGFSDLFAQVKRASEDFDVQEPSDNAIDDAAPRDNDLEVEEENAAVFAQQPIPQSEAATADDKSVEPESSSIQSKDAGETENPAQAESAVEEGDSAETLESGESDDPVELVDGAALEATAEATVTDEVNVSQRQPVSEVATSEVGETNSTSSDTPSEVDETGSQSNQENGQESSEGHHNENSQREPNRLDGQSADFLTGHLDAESTSEPSQLELQPATGSIDAGSDPLAHVSSTPLRVSSSINQLYSPTAAPVHSSPASLAQFQLAQPVAGAIQSAISLTETNGTREVSIELSPAELGHLSIRVEQTDESITARIIATESISTDLLESQKQSLLESLAELGYENANVDISHRESETDNSDQRQNSAEQKQLLIDNPNGSISLQTQRDSAGLNIIA